MGQFIFASIGVFLITILLLVIILLICKKYLSPSGNVTITINGDKKLNVAQGESLMATLNENGIYASIGMWRKSQLRTVQGAGPRGRRRDSRL